MSWYARFRLWLDAKLAPKATSWIKYGWINYGQITDTTDPLPPTP